MSNTGLKRAAIFEAYDVDYHRYMHLRMAPFAVLLIVSCLLVLFAYPFSLRQSVIKPLHSLYEAMRKADQGDLDVAFTPQYNDEIGFLGRSFNQMIRSIKRMAADFRSLADDSLDGILILRQNGTPEYANRRVSQITGYGSDEIMSTNFDELLRTAAFRDVAVYAAEAEGVREPPHHQTEITHRQGVRVPVELTLSRTLWLGDPARVVVVRDITARKREEERAREQQEQLMRNDKLITLGVVAAGMAHEINNPNQSILSNVSILQRACPQLLSVLADYCEQGDLLGGLDQEMFRAKLPQLLSAIAGCSGRIDSIVKNLRGFSQEQPEGLTPGLDLNAVVESAVELTSTLIKKATANFAVRLFRDLPGVRGNAQRIEQVIINLILNACQALVCREQGITVSTRCERENDQVVVAVEDQGVGIPEDQLPHVTEAFFTTKRSSGGTGLGLYIAESIVKEHCGILRFCSRPGLGTTAEVALQAGERP